MTNKKLILGIAAGVAALAVVGIICNKKDILISARCWIRQAIWPEK